MANAQFPSTPEKTTPYANSRFRIKWGDKYVAGFSQITLEPGVANDGNIAHQPETFPVFPPGTSQYPGINFERGLSRNGDFEMWASNPMGLNSTDAGVSDLCKDLIVEVYDDEEHLTATYKGTRCWVAKFEVLSKLDGNTNMVVIQSMVVVSDSWQEMQDNSQLLK